MNQLSWLLYMADVSGSLGWFLTFVFVVSVIWCIGCFISFFIMMDEAPPATPEQWALWRKAINGGLTALIVSFTVGALLPSKETVYAIAASEVGEQLVSSPTANKAVRALNEWLDQQIGSAAEEEPRDNRDNREER